MFRGILIYTNRKMNAVLIWINKEKKKPSQCNRYKLILL